MRPCFLFVLQLLHGVDGNIVFRRVTEAFHSAVPVIGVICGVIYYADPVFGNDHVIYHWADPNDVKQTR